jgi:hypothetical protein
LRRLWRALWLLLEELEELRRRSVCGQYQRGNANGAAQRSGFDWHAPHPLILPRLVCRRIVGPMPGVSYNVRTGAFVSHRKSPYFYSNRWPGVA